MDIQIVGMVALLRSALTGEASPIPENFDLSKAVPVFRKHHLAGLALQGATCCGFPRNHPAVVQLTALFCQHLQMSRTQMRQLQEVFSLFDANGIDYLPVKGTVIKPLYAKPEHRVMFDADILIREEQYPIIQRLLPSLSFREEENCDYEHTWSSPCLKLELHRYLVSEQFKHYFDYYRDCWRFAKKEETSSRYCLSAEDHFVYQVVHFAKHYLNGTICAKDICDFYVWRNAHPDMDEDYMRRQFETLQLADFYPHILALLDNWFTGGAPTEATELITRSAFRGGVFEEYNRSAAENVVNRNASRSDSLQKKKLNWFLSSVFPSAATLSHAHPVLKRFPILLPVFWIVRWFDALFRNNDRLKRGMIVMKMDEKALTEYDEHLEKVGLVPTKSELISP